MLKHQKWQHWLQPHQSAFSCSILVRSHTDPKTVIGPDASDPGLSQMQLQKSPEQYQKIPKSVVVQHKIGVRMINKIGVRKIELNIICKIN